MCVRLPRLISDGMVLQRGKAWLWGEADVRVGIHFMGKNYSAVPDAQGRWRLQLDAGQAGGPYELIIGDRTLRDVYIGEVWLCTGQSNMQLPMNRVRYRYPDAWQNSTPRLRQFTVAQRMNFTGPCDDLDEGEWISASPETLDAFTAVGYFFGQALMARYDVPVGLILCAIGGTPIQAWMGRDALADFPALLAEADQCRDESWVTSVQEQEQQRAAAYLRDLNARDPGLRERWFDPSFDDSAWTIRPLLEGWDGPGTVWLRKTVNIPDTLAGEPATLFLGTVLDADTVYLDGERIGETGYRYPPRIYQIPALPKGRCQITLHITSHQPGGFEKGKQYLLATAKGAIDLRETWRFQKGAAGEGPPVVTNFANKPTGLFHGMTAPLRHFGVAGAIWYQGESDTGAPEGYAKKFAAMARCWRDAWNDPFPICFTELAHWDGGADWDALRCEQRQSLRVPHTAMAAADELGEYNDLHPQGKRDVGERLARSAMRLAYGEALPPSPFEIIWTE